MKNINLITNAIMLRDEENMGTEVFGEKHADTLFLKMRKEIV